MTHSTHFSASHALRLALVLVASLAFVNTAAAQYTAQILLAPSDVPSNTGTRAFSLNNRGQVFGEVLGANRGPVLWTNGVPARLPVPAGYAIANAGGSNLLNDEGVAITTVGRVQGGVLVQGFGDILVWQNGIPSLLPPVPEVLIAGCSEDYGKRPLGINGAGHIFGVSVGLTIPGNPGSNTCRRYWIYKNGSFDMLPTQAPPGTQGCALAYVVTEGGANLLNNADHVAVQRAGINSPTCPFIGGVLAGTSFTSTGPIVAIQINNHDQVIGWSPEANGQTRSYFWNGSGLVDFGVTVGWFSMNNLGQVLFRDITLGCALRLYSNGTTSNVAVPAGFSYLNSSCDATQLNDGGQIVVSPQGGQIVLLTPSGGGTGDTTPPGLANIPGNLTVTATSGVGATVQWTSPTADDDRDGPVPAVCVPASGSLFPIGSTTVTCTATDSSGNIGIGSFTVTVLDSPPRNSAPVAQSMVVTTQPDMAQSGVFRATDPDGGALTFSIVTPPAHGTVALINAATGLFTYTPLAGFGGSDSFTFMASDTTLSSNVATVAIVFAAGPAAATLYGIGDLPGGPFVSVVRDATRANGVLYAVGGSAANNQIECVGPNNPAGCVVDFNPDTAVLWTGGSVPTLSALPDLVTPATLAVNPLAASAITRDANYIASQARSNADSPGQALAVRVARNGLVNLNISAPPFLTLSPPANAIAISEDGAILYSNAGNPVRAGRVDANATATAVIPLLFGSHTGNVVAVRGSSIDGAVAVGTSFVAPFTGTNGRAFRYVHAAPVGTVSAIPLLVGGTWNKAVAVSPDGRLALVAGDSAFLPNGEVYLFDAVTGMTTRLGSPNTPWVPANLGGMTADGSVVATTFLEYPNAGGQGYVRNAQGWFQLTTVLAAQGINLAAAGWDLAKFQINGVSPDGTLIWGLGEHDGNNEGFVAEFPAGYLASFDMPAVPPADTSIVGVWGAGQEVIMFLADGTYFHLDGIHGSQPAGEFSSGFERGRYYWDATGAYSWATLQDTNGSVGFSGGNGILGLTATVSGDTLDIGNGGLVITRMAGGSGSIVGGWVFGDPRVGDSSSVLVLSPDGTFIFAEDGNTSLDPSGHDGIEAGTYSQGADGALTFTVTLDMNGGWGFGDGHGGGSTVTLPLSADGLHLGAPGNPIRFSRIADPQLFAPVITSPLTAAGVVGLPFSYTISATYAASFGAVGLPIGLSIDTATGLISGTPTSAGAFNVTLSAVNSFGNSTSAVLVVTVASPLTARNAVLVTQVGAAASGTLSATAAGGSPLTFSILSTTTKGTLTLVDAGTGAVTYTPDSGAIGYDSFTFQAADGSGASATATGAVFIVAASPRWPGQTVRVSVASSAAEGNGNSVSPSVSADGRYIAFASLASNLVPADTNGKADVFVHDRETGVTTRVSVASDGSESNSDSYGPVLSADGRYVAFPSLASNLVPGDTNGAYDIFVHDLLTGETTRGSVASGGVQGNDHSYDRPSLSADGRYVAFRSRASNLASGDANGVEDVFVHDRQTDVTTRVSVASDGTEANDASDPPELSADGRLVRFTSVASNLVAGDTNGVRDVFVHDLFTRVTARVSVASDGTQANQGSDASSMSADGRYIAFQSSASNLVVGDTNSASDVFVHDRQTGTTTRVSVASNGAQANDFSYTPALSADGRYVSYRSVASNFAAGDAFHTSDVFVYDRQVGAVTHVSVSGEGAFGNGDSDAPVISADASFIAFPSLAVNLVAGDTNSSSDIFVVGGVSTSPATFDMPAAGGVRSVQVAFDYPGTPWAATATAPWITVDPLVGGSTSGAVTFTVAPNTGVARTGTIVVALHAVTVNQQPSSPPVAQAGAVTTAEDTAVAGTLVATDPDGDPITFSVLTQPTRGTVVLTDASTGGFAYTPALNRFGGDSFTFQASAGGQVSNIATVTVNVTPVNDAPLAFDASVDATEDTPVTGNLLAGDPDSLVVRFEVVSQPEHGSVTIPGGPAPPLGGSFTYVPHANYNGPDSFTYRVVDGIEISNVATVTISVASVNDAPVTTSTVVTTQESTTQSGVLAASDADGDALTYSIVTPAGRGTVQIVNASTGAFTYTPFGGVYGLGYDTFEFRATDGAGAASSSKVMVFAVAATPRWPGHTQRTSLGANGAQGNGNSQFPVLSADGRMVAFQSTASNLVAGDTNGLGDVFVRDQYAGETTRVSVASNGAQGNDASFGAKLSAEGWHVAFLSLASNLVAGDTNGTVDAFVRDLLTGQTTRVSVSSTGGQGNGGINGLSISADGRYVAFSSTSSNLVASDTNGATDVFVHDRRIGQTTRVSVSSGGLQGNGSSLAPVVSADGRFVGFTSSASNLVPGDFNGASDAFVHDRLTGQTIRVSVSSNGTPGNGDTSLSALSADGRFVAMLSNASNLVPGSTSGRRDVFVHDRQTGETTRVNVASDGTPGNDWSFSPVLSADGRYVAFPTHATNLVPDDVNGTYDVFVHDRQTGDTRRVSLASTGPQGNSSNEPPAMSADARYLAYSSDSPNLVPSDNNGSLDIFLVGGVSVGPTPINVSATGGPNRVAVVLDYLNFGAPLAATTTTPWITITSQPQGEAWNWKDAFFTVAPNMGSPRTGTIVVAQQPVVVTQEGFNVPAGGVVPVGSQVTVGPVDPTGVWAPITLRFSEVTQQGLATATPMTLPPVSSRYQLKGTIWDIVTTAVYTPPVTVCFMGMFGPRDFLLHYEDGAWKNITTGISTSDDVRVQICGQVSSLSPFGIGEPQDSSPNQPPVAANRALAAIEDTTATGFLVATDGDDAALNFGIATQPAHGVVTISNGRTGAFTYTPAPNFSGADSFTFLVADPWSASNVATVSVIVTPVNDAPVASDGTLAVDFNTATTGIFAATDVDGPALSFAIVTNGSRGTATVTNAATGVFTYTPNAGASGSDSIQFRVSDGSLTSVGTVSITIAPSPTPTVILRTPNGGERVFVNTQTAIEWTATGAISLFDVELSRNNGSTFAPIPGCMGLPGTAATCAWTPTTPTSATAMIRVTGRAASGISASDRSDGPFSIVTGVPVVAVSAPNTAVTWSVGTARVITWTHNLGSPSFIRVELTRDGGATWETLAASVQNTTVSTGTLNWVVTGPATSNALVRVSTLDGLVSDVSNVPFTIQAPTLTVTSPNTNVAWRAGTNGSMTFSHNLGAGQVVHLDVSRDNGATWTRVTSVTTTAMPTASYAWPVSVPETTQGRVRATWAANAMVSDVSDVAFTITSRIRVLSPNTATTWSAGTTRTITWNHNLPSGAMVDIAFSPDNGASWIPVASGVPNQSATSGSYTGRFPATLTTQGLLRVSSSSNALDNDVNDVPLTVVAPTMAVTAPGMNTTWTIGSPRTISWTHNLGTAESVAIEISRDGGASWAPIVASTPNTLNTSGSFAWTVTGPATSTARIRVSWTIDGTVQGVSGSLRVQ